MKITLKNKPGKNAQLVVLATCKQSAKNISADYFDKETNQSIATFISGKQLDKIKASCLTMVKGKQISHIIICSTGNKTWDNYQMSQWVQEVLTATEDSNAKHIYIDIESLALATKTADSQQLIAGVSQFLLHHKYRFYKYKSDSTKTPDLYVNLLIANYSATTKQLLDHALATDNGKTLARDLSNMPANDCDINHLVDVARNLSKDNKIKLRIIDERSMKKLGMGAFLAVTRGSTKEGKLIILEYRGAGKNDPFHALIGKGLTFDTGGISLKPAAGMEEMKYDMCGAASVLGACQTIITLKARVNALFVVAAAENMPSGEATRPGDIVTTHEGLTVEILNTDAEGRLVLCDTISYINKQYAPQSMIDIATLTGACVVALGHHASALYTNSNAMSENIQKAAERSGDRVWPMPLWQEYQDQLSSNIADLPNISGGRDAGSVTAACFLSRFAKGTEWAHLDIAGTGWQSGKNKQATGRPTALLVDYLLDKQ